MGRESKEENIQDRKKWKKEETKRIYMIQKMWVTKEIYRIKKKQKKERKEEKIQDKNKWENKEKRKIYRIEISGKRKKRREYIGQKNGETKKR